MVNALLLLLILAIPLLARTPNSTLLQNPPAKGPVADSSSRPCSVNPVLGTSPKAKPTSKSKHPVTPEPLPACVEVTGEPIEVQEFLQSIVREFRWRVGENHASEDTWSFVRYLNELELEKLADTNVLLETAQFTGGKVAVAIRTQDTGDRYVRVQITTHFQGDGKSNDRISGQPGTVWPLNSKGVLEQELLDALKSRFKHAA